MIPTLPHRFSESAFRRYEQTIADLVTAYPSAIEVNPSSFGLSSETVRGRLRDALDSYDKHRWPSTKIDSIKYITLSFPLLAVRLRDDGMVVAGPKDALKGNDIRIIVAPPAAITGIQDVTNFTGELYLNAFAFLAHNQALSKKLKVWSTAEVITALSSRYDCVFEKTADPNTYLLS